MSAGKPLTTEEFEKIYSKVTRLCVLVAVRIDKGILLTLRKELSWKGKWHIPGGTVYFHEKIEEALKRVALEELGVKVEPSELLGYIEYFSEQKERGFGYTVGLVFLCNANSEDFELNEQAEDVRFFLNLPENIVEEESSFLRKNLGFK